MINIYLKQKRLKYIFLGVLLFALESGNAAIIAPLAPMDSANSAEIFGKIIGPYAQTDSLHIILLRDIIFDKLGSIDISVPIDNQGMFFIKLHAINHPARIILYLSNFEGNYLDRYIVDSGDKVFITINKNDTSFIFSGKGSAKFTCKMALDKEAKEDQPYINDLEKRSGFWSVDNTNARIRLGDKLLQKRTKILNQFKNELTTEDYSIIKADIFGDISVNWQCPNWGSNFIADRLNKKKILKLYKQILSRTPDTIPGNILALSPNYIRYLFLRSAEKLSLEKEGNGEYALDKVYYTNGFRSLYRCIKNDYTGILREKVLMQLLMNNLVQVDDHVYDSCLSDAIPMIQTPYTRELVENTLGHKRKGTKVFNFILPDTSGNMVSLSSLKGKVVFIDIWFTGCHACLGLSREIEKNVYPQFMNNSRVAFVSISMDVNRDQWLRSVHEEKYTSRSYINLYTGGLGIDHPFLKYYNVQGGPTLMLIDKQGRIFSAVPPKHGESKELIALIREALSVN